ncbi:unnamed protein product, partial [marine sediment metagenome]
MKTGKSIAVLAAVLALAGVRPVLAQEDKEAAARPQIIKVLVKQYKTLSAG